MTDRRRAGLSADDLLADGRRYRARRVRLPGAARVFAELGSGQVVEIRPGGSGAFDVPDCARWWVQPTPARLTQRLAATLRDLSIPGLCLYRAALEGAELSLLAGCPELRWLSLERCTKLEQTALACLPDVLPQVEVLNLGACRVSAEGLAHVARLPVLTRLVLAWSKALNDADVESLAAASNLERLCLYDCRKVSDEGLSRLPRSLKHLDLRGCVKIRGHRLDLLGRLEELALDGTRVDDEGLLAVSRLGALRAITLTAHDTLSPGGVAALARTPVCDVRIGATPYVGDDHADRLAAASALRRVRVERTALGDAGLARLAELPALRDLCISWTAITAAGLDSLRARPLRRLEVAGCPVDLGVVHGLVQDLASLRALDAGALQGPREPLVALARRRSIDLALGGNGGDGSSIQRLPAPPRVARAAWIATPSPYA